MTLTGVDDAIRGLRQFQQEQKAKLGASLKVSVLPVKNESEEQCPYESGTLVGSSYVTNPYGLAARYQSQSDTGSGMP